MIINTKKELWITRISTFATVIAIAGLFHYLLVLGYSDYKQHKTAAVLETVLFSLAMFFIAYSNLLYHVCLAGFYSRRRTHRPATRADLDRLYDGRAPSLSVLVPSYKEEYDVNWQTLVSAALSEYPQKNVVLLIDDPYFPASQRDAQALEETRRIPAKLQALFDVPRVRFSHELQAFEQRLEGGNFHAGVELNRLSILYEQAADWLDGLAADFVKDKSEASLSHIDRFYLGRVIGEPTAAHREKAHELRHQMYSARTTSAEIHTQYRRVAGLFTVRFSSFERKKYANLSHEANKAMNLNSYISLIGKSWKEVEIGRKLCLVECPAEDAQFTFAAADYVNTIDSDSMMLSDYLLRLVHKMESPGNERVAVTQSPCSAYPGAQNGIERAAGAAIDLQYKLHQGYTHWNAAFWVGANAMLRFRALQDIREIRSENGHEISVFIQDRTVIEDTESSIDLIHKGWQLSNYPKRMTFSSMPADFGSLLIQRRRWANGGLLILPKLFSYALHAPKRLALLKELFMRFHYLASAASGCLVAAMLVFYPFASALQTIWIPCLAIPSSLLYLRDLRNTGYNYKDFLRIAALNLLLLPVIIGGVLKSLEQLATGKKIPFSRTPKIPGRTMAPALYSLMAIALPFVCMAMAGYDAGMHHTGQGFVAFVNGLFLLYAWINLVGVHSTFQDVTHGARRTIAAANGFIEETLTVLRRSPIRSSRLQSN